MIWRQNSRVRDAYIALGKTVRHGFKGRCLRKEIFEEYCVFQESVNRNSQAYLIQLVLLGVDRVPILSEESGGDGERMHPSFSCREHKWWGRTKSGPFCLLSHAEGKGKESLECGVYGRQRGHMNLGNRLTHSSSWLWGNALWKLLLQGCVNHTTNIVLLRFCVGMWSQTKEIFPCLPIAKCQTFPGQSDHPWNSIYMNCEGKVMWKSIRRVPTWPMRMRENLTSRANVRWNY